MHIIISKNNVIINRTTEEFASLNTEPEPQRQRDTEKKSVLASDVDPQLARCGSGSLIGLVKNTGSDLKSRKYQQFYIFQPISQYLL